MKKYRVRLYFETYADVDVTADNRQQAIEYARERAQNKELLENLQEVGKDTMVWNEQLKDYQYV